jgi:hypothetical protein
MIGPSAAVTRRCGRRNHHRGRRVRHDIPPRRHTLSADDLRGMCNGGRDISAEAIISLIGNSPHAIRIERLQVEHLGIMNGGYDQKHGSVIVTLPDGKKFLIDPTFAQFADWTTDKQRAALVAEMPIESRVTPARAFPLERMISTVEGSAVACDLIRDGIVPLTDETARQYLLGLGADATNVDALTERLLTGDANVLTEVVQNGRVTRSTECPDEAADEIGTVSDEGTFTNAIDRMLANMPPNDPLRPMLQTLGMRLKALAKSRTLPPFPEPEE